MEETQIQETEKAPMHVINGALQLGTIDDLWRTAQMFVQSGLCPQQLDTPQKVVVALQAGAELGFKPWQSLQSLHVVNGRVGLEGAAMLALVRKSRVCDYVSCVFTGTPYEDNYQAVVKSKRRIEVKENITTFSVADAKRAKLWDAKDNWKKYPKDMLTWRAVSRHCRRYYSDEISGMYSVDELENLESQPLSQTFDEEKPQTGAKGLIERMREQTQAVTPEKAKPVESKATDTPEPEEKPKRGRKKGLYDFICPVCSRTYRYGAKEGIGVKCECGKANIIRKPKAKDTKPATETRQAPEPLQQPELGPTTPDEEFDNYQPPAEETQQQTAEMESPRDWYECQNCGASFEEPGLTGTAEDLKPQCPKCLSLDIEKTK